MKTVTAQQLARAYAIMNPQEGSTAAIEETMGNWLARYERKPSAAIATTNWAGKVTAALFKALGIQQPKTKTRMLEVLS